MLVDIILFVVKDVFKGVVKLFIEVLGVFVVIGIVVDFGLLVWNLVDLFNFNKGKLC